MATRTVAFILDNTCGRIAHTIERTEEILTTRTPEEDSKEEDSKEEDSKEEDSKAEDSKDADSKEADSIIKVAVSQEEAEEMTSTSMDMEEAIAAPLLPINQDNQAGIVITAMDNTMDNTFNRCTTVHHMIRYRILQTRDGTDNQKWLMV